MPLSLREIYDSMPNLKKLVKGLEHINVGGMVVIIPFCTTVSDIAYERVNQISGNCEELSNINIKKGQLFIK